METIRYRPRWWQVPWYLPALPLLQVTFRPGGRVSGAAWLVGLGLAAFLALEVVWVASRGVELRPDALVMRGIRKRVIPWRDITWIGPAPMLGMQCVGVATSRDGTMRLRAPQHMPVLSPDKDFLRKAHTIHDTWVARRGPDWEPPRPYVPATAAGSWPT